MNSKGKTEAKKFLEKYNLWDITSQNLKRICDDMGYTVVEFNHIYNDENVKTLLEALNIKKYAESSKGFTYADKNYRLIFLHDGLSEEEKTVVLSHEIGHVCCGHFNTAPILGKDVFEEYEANEFSRYILQRREKGGFSKTFFKHKKLAAFLAALVVFAGIAYGAFSLAERQKSYYGEFYVTPQGESYHEKECIFIKNKTTARRLTKEEFESGKYKPCRICIPHGEK